VSSCVVRAVKNERNTTRSVPLSPVQWPVRPWSKIAIDIIGEFSKVPESKWFAISIIDYHSRWPEVFLRGSVTSSVVIKCLTDLFARWGVREELVSENGVQFVSHEFEQFLQSCDIEHVRTSLYYPQSNGLVQRFNSSVKQAIRNAVTEGNPLTLQFERCWSHTGLFRSRLQPSVRRSRCLGSNFGSLLILLALVFCCRRRRERKRLRLAKNATLTEESGQHQR
jgi:hypothetical protein